VKKMVLAGLLVISMASAAVAAETNDVTCLERMAQEATARFVTEADELERLQKMGKVKVECTSHDVFKQPTWVKVVTLGMAADYYQDVQTQRFEWKGGLDAVRLVLERNKDFDLIVGGLVKHLFSPGLMESRAKCVAEGQKPLTVKYDGKEGRYEFGE